MGTCFPAGSTVLCICSLCLSTASFAVLSYGFCCPHEIGCFPGPLLLLVLRRLPFCCVATPCRLRVWALQFLGSYMEDDGISVSSATPVHSALALLAMVLMVEPLTCIMVPLASVMWHSFTEWKQPRCCGLPSWPGICTPFISWLLLHVCLRRTFPSPLCCSLHPHLPCSPRRWWVPCLSNTWIPLVGLHGSGCSVG